MQITVADHVRHVLLNDMVILLDLRSGVYAALQPPAARMWDEALRNVAPASPDERDLQEAFVAEMMEAGLFVEARPPECGAGREAGTPARRPTTASAIMTLLRIDRLLRRDGFASIYSMIQHLDVEVRPATAATLARVVGTFIRAENILWWRRRNEDCLPRSLALYWFCRSAGLDVRHVIGVCANPFQAHAWVSHDGSLVLDTPARTMAYVPIAEV